MDALTTSHSSTTIQDMIMFIYSFMFEALGYFLRYLVEIENKIGKSMKTLRADCRQEHLSDQFKELLEQKGIV